MQPDLPRPWSDFLADLDRLLPEPVQLHCLGGFVLIACYKIPRPTADIDCVAVVPQRQLETLLRLAGPESPLAKKLKIYFQYSAATPLPDHYDARLIELFPGRFKNLRLFALDPYDLILSKLHRNSEKDRHDVGYLAKTLALDPGVLRERYQQELRPYVLGRSEWHDQTLEMWIEAYFSGSKPPN